MSNLGVNPHVLVLLLGGLNLAVLGHQTATFVCLVLALLIHVASVYEDASR